MYWPSNARSAPGNDGSLSSCMFPSCVFGRASGAYSGNGSSSGRRAISRQAPSVNSGCWYSSGYRGRFASINKSSANQPVRCRAGPTTRNIPTPRAPARGRYETLATQVPWTNVQGSRCAWHCAWASAKLHPCNRRRQRGDASLDAEGRGGKPRGAVGNNLPMNQPSKNDGPWPSTSKRNEGRGNPMLASVAAWFINWSCNRRFASCPC